MPQRETKKRATKREIKENYGLWWPLKGVKKKPPTFIIAFYIYMHARGCGFVKQIILPCCGEN